MCALSPDVSSPESPGIRRDGDTWRACLRRKDRFFKGSSAYRIGRELYDFNARIENLKQIPNQKVIDVLPQEFLQKFSLFRDALTYSAVKGLPHRIRLFSSWLFILRTEPDRCGVGNGLRA
jgi:hypothetical protein